MATSAGYRTAPDYLIDSASIMSAEVLRDAVVAARTERGWNATALQRHSGLSARTVRDIENANPTRRYSSTTLAALDKALGWASGHALTLWRPTQYTGAPPEVASIAEQMTMIMRRIDQLDERPAWADELVDSARLLSAEDRRRVLDLIDRLSQR